VVGQDLILDRKKENGNSWKRHTFVNVYRCESSKEK
jgi:hypothetical protein